MEQEPVLKEVVAEAWNAEPPDADPFRRLYLLRIIDSDKAFFDGYPQAHAEPGGELGAFHLGV